MRKKRVKFISYIIAILMMMVMSGCCLKHEWQQAACTSPQICSKCGETEGEALGHTWADATCSEPKSCDVCGAIEGTVLEHTLTEANYQQAPTCSVCNSAVGEPLQAEFEKYGLVCDVELNRIYDGVMMCYNNTEKVTMPKVVFSNYKVFDSDDFHPAKEGYEWRTVDVVLFYYDDNAMNEGWRMGSCCEDYYDVVGFDESSVWDEESEKLYFTVNYNGVDYDECQEYETSIEKMMFDNADSSSRAFTVNCLVPKGYDGCVYGLRNLQIAWEENQYIYDLDNTDTLFFRFLDVEDIKLASEEDVSEINLSAEVAAKVVSHFYMNMLNYFDEEIIGAFDMDANGSIDQEESIYLLEWALNNYSTEESTAFSLTEDVAVRIAADYLSGNLNVPDSLDMELE